MAQGQTAAAGESFEPEKTSAFRSTRVATPEGLCAAAVVVRGERIVEVARWDEVPDSAELRDFADLILLPGLVDTHVHMNEAGPQHGRTDWEGFGTATRAAAAGGVTTVVDMPLNCVPETISLSALEAKQDASRSQVSVDWMTWGGVVGNGGSGGNEAAMPGLMAAGVPGFKGFLVDSGIDGFQWVDEAQLRLALASLQGTGLPLLAHAELAGPVERATAGLQAAGANWRQYATYLASRPDTAELEAIELLIRLAAEFDTPVHVVHLSSAQALPILKRAREAGVKITVESCPQYLWFAADDVPDAATEFKCAPPIRSAANREELWAGLMDGVIDMIVTDHSPCLPEMKVPDSGRFDRAWGGVASLGLALPIVWTALERRGVGLEEAAKRVGRWMASGPAELAGISGKKGALAVGYDADLVVFDPDARWRVVEEDLEFRHKISPYLGVELAGRVRETYLRGERVYSRNGGLSGGNHGRAMGRELRRNPGRTS